MQNRHLLLPATRRRDRLPEQLLLITNMFQANLQALQPPFPNLLQNPSLTRPVTIPRSMRDPNIKPQHPQIRKIMKQASQARNTGFIPITSKHGSHLDDFEFRDEATRGLQRLDLLQSGWRCPLAKPRRATVEPSLSFPALVSLVIWDVDAKCVAPVQHRQCFVQDGFVGPQEWKLAGEDGLEFAFSGRVGLGCCFDLAGWGQARGARMLVGEVVFVDDCAELEREGEEVVVSCDGGRG